MQENWSYNDWANYWRYQVGVNVIPANTGKKIPLVEWKESPSGNWQTEPIPEDIHQKWIVENKFKDGMAVICGQVFHNPEKTGLWLNGIDCDNKLGTDEVCPNGVDKIALITVVEQHANKNKCHAYYYTKEPIESRPSSGGDDVPRIEIKSGGKFLMYCAGGVHADGSKIEILNNREVKILDKESLETVLNDIFTKYGLVYPKATLVERTTPLYEQDSSQKLHQGDNRGIHILSYLVSKKMKNPEFDQDDLFVLACKYEEEHCADKYDDAKINDLAKQAIDYARKNDNNPTIPNTLKSISPEVQKELDDNFAILRRNLATKKQKREAQDRIMEIQRLAGLPVSSFEEVKITHEDIGKKILSESHFSTVGETGQILTYKNGIYVDDNAEVEIKKRCQQLVPYCTVNFVNEVVQMIKRATYTKLEDFDKDPDVINVQNCLLNIITLEPSEHTPKYPSLVQWGMKYNPSAKCKYFPKFINDVLVNPKQRVTVYEMFGGLLWKYDTLNKSYFPLGSGQNGKSVLCSVIESFCGKNNSSHTSFHELADDTFATSDLVGKVVNINPDGDDVEIKEIGDWKKIVNHEPIRAQGKHQKSFDFRPFCKMIMGFNKPPKISNRQPATYRRIVPLNFDVRFKENPTQEELNNGVKKIDEDFVAKLFSENELSGLLNIALKTYAILKKRKFHVFAPSDEEVKKIWETKADTIKEFAEECLSVDKDAYMSKADVYAVYVKFCDNKGYSPMGNTRFYQELVQQLGGNVIKTDRKRILPNPNPVHVFTGIWVKGVQKPDYLLPQRASQQTRVDN